MKRLALAVVLLAGCGGDKPRSIVIRQDASGPKRLSVVEGIGMRSGSAILRLDLPSSEPSQVLIR